ncbi:MAG: DNA photolyase family protein [Anaerolineae bacterium]|nr:DNA photolyase family protein [Anaerolineae bacterium]
MSIIHWFRRDLRLIDNTALSQAITASGGDILPVFILDERLLRGKDVAPARVQFMLDCLRDLDKNLRARGSRLIVRRGDPTTELIAIAKASGANALYFNRDYTPLARARDGRVTAALQAEGVAVSSFKDAVIHEPDELRTGSGAHYTVFTPYKKKWLDLPKQPSLTLENELLRPPSAKVDSLPIPSASDLGFKVTQQVAKGGETAAQAQFNAVLNEGRLDHYHEQRDYPALDGTSRLSPHLRFGTISPRTCYHAAITTRTETVGRQSSTGDVNGVDVWISELVWREFYVQVLYHFPHADKGSFKRDYDALKWGSGNAAKDQKLFTAWCEGKTGFPIVDAAMRQLNQTGWMHNRSRMITASFLTKDLLLDWRWGESYFMQKLVDGDPASNNGGWQWAASTGTDAQPYFRIFNPSLQAERFDPKGVYIRKWIPELARVPDEYIHNLPAMPPLLGLQRNCVLGQNYPHPIVDHNVQKDIIVARFKAIK